MSHRVWLKVGMGCGGADTRPAAVKSWHVAHTAEGCLLLVVQDAQMSLASDNSQAAASTAAAQIEMGDQQAAAEQLLEDVPLPTSDQVQTLCTLCIERLCHATAPLPVALHCIFQSCPCCYLPPGASLRSCLDHSLQRMAPLEGTVPCAVLPVEKGAYMSWMWSCRDLTSVSPCCASWRDYQTYLAIKLKRLPWPPLQELASQHLAHSAATAQFVGVQMNEEAHTASRTVADPTQQTLSQVRCSRVRAAACNAVGSPGSVRETCARLLLPRNSTVHKQCRHTHRGGAAGTSTPPASSCLAPDSCSSRRRGTDSSAPRTLLAASATPLLPVRRALLEGFPLLLGPFH